MPFSMELCEFPKDILFRILSRLPVQDLLRLRCVSKLLLEIIDDSSFRHMHLKQDVEEAKLLVLEKAKIAPKGIHENNDQYWKVGLRLVYQLGGSKSVPISMSSCNGLIFFLNSTEDGFVLFNPLTQEGITVPGHAVAYYYDSFGIGYDSMSNKYKIVHVSCKVSSRGDGGLDYWMTAHVHTVGTSFWREIEAPSCTVLSREGIFTSGAIFWTAYPTSLQNRIACFDLEREEFIFICSPRDVSSLKNQLVDLRGFLGLYKHSRDHILEIWVLKDLHKQKWEKEYRIDLSLWTRDSDRFSHIRNFVEVMGLKKNGDVLLKILDSYFFWNPQSSLLECINICTTMGTMIVFHVGNLVPLSMWAAKKV